MIFSVFSSFLNPYVANAKVNKYEDVRFFILDNNADAEKYKRTMRNVIYDEKNNMKRTDGPHTAEV